MTTSCDCFEDSLAQSNVENEAEFWGAIAKAALPLVKNVLPAALPMVGDLVGGLFGKKGRSKKGRRSGGKGRGGGAKSGGSRGARRRRGSGGGSSYAKAMLVS